MRVFTDYHYAISPYFRLNILRLLQAHRHVFYLHNWPKIAPDVEPAVIRIRSPNPKHASREVDGRLVRADPEHDVAKIAKIFHYPFVPRIYRKHNSRSQDGCQHVEERMHYQLKSLAGVTN